MPREQGWVLGIEVRLLSSESVEKSLLLIGSTLRKSELDPLFSNIGDSLVKFNLSFSNVIVILTRALVDLYDT